MSNVMDAKKIKGPGPLIFFAHHSQLSSQPTPYLKRLIKHLALNRRNVGRA